MRKYIRCLLWLTLFLCSPSHADGNCPAGYYEVGGNGVSGCNAYPSSSGAYSNADPQWSSRWGAIATASGGILGVANDAGSRAKAEKAALKQCKAKGGQGCLIDLSFGNQCGALAWGDNYSYAFSSPDLAIAEAESVKSCSMKAEGCRVFYSACSYAEKIR